MILFAFFEKANFSTVERCIRKLIGEGRDALFLKPFDYKEHEGSISRFEVPADVPFVDATELAASEAAPRKALPRPEKHFLLDAFFRREYVPFVEGMYARVASATERLLEERGPSLVVLPEDTDYMKGRLAAGICSRLGIPTLAVLPVYYNIQLRYPMLGPRLAGGYLTMNERARERLTGAGADPAQVRVIGHAAFDDLPRDSAPGGSRPYVFLLQDLPWEREIVADLVEVFRRRPDLELVVRPHPERAPIVLGELPRNVRVRADLGVPEAACVIAQSSQGLYAALHCGIPIVPVNYGPFPHEIDLPEAIPVAGDSAALERCIAAVSERRGYVSPESLEAYLSPPGAADRLFDIVRAA